jgi:hypothetical protein
VRLSFAQSVGEVAMSDGARSDDAGEGDRAEDDAEQHHQHRLLREPRRRDVGGGEQVLRGKTPETPG